MQQINVLDEIIEKLRYKMKRSVQNWDLKIFTTFVQEIA